MSANIVNLSKSLAGLVVSNIDDLKDKHIHILSDESDGDDNTANNSSASIEKQSTSFESDSLTAIDEPPPRSRPSSCLFVASLNASYTDDQLFNSVTNHFSQWGKINFVKVLRDLSERPYAFVQFYTNEDAKKALQLGQGSFLNNRYIRCEPARVNRTLFIHQSGPPIKERELHEFLSKFGEIEDLVDAKLQITTTNPIGHGWFAKFAYREDAIKAYWSTRSTGEYEVEWAQNLDNQPGKSVVKTIDAKSVFVGQLNPDTSQSELREVFGKHGEIILCQVISKDPKPETVPTSTLTRRSSAFAFITFATEDAASAAVEHENHRILRDHTIHVQYKEVHTTTFNTTPRLEYAPPPINVPSRTRTVRRAHAIPAVFGQPGLIPSFKPMGMHPANVQLQMKQQQRDSESTPTVKPRAKSYSGIGQKRWITRDGYAKEWYNGKENRHYHYDYRPPRSDRYRNYSYYVPPYAYEYEWQSHGGYPPYIPKRQVKE